MFEPITSKGKKIKITLSKEIRESLYDLIEQYKDLINPDLEDSKRLFPTAYPNDPSKNQEFSLLTTDQLIDLKHSNADTFQNTINNKFLSEPEAESWLTVLNDMRLILGTRLDISEESIIIDSDDEDTVYLYESLSVLTSLLVKAISESLELE